MILDKLENSKLYFGAYKGFDKAFDFIAKFHDKELADGRYDIEGDQVYALVQSYETVPWSEMKWEAHKNYIDLQCVIKGREIIGYTHIDNLVPSVEYNVEKDVILFKENEGIELKLQDMWFSILFPEDAHKPKCVWDKAEPIKKIIVKIKV